MVTEMLYWATLVLVSFFLSYALLFHILPARERQKKAKKAPFKHSVEDSKKKLEEIKQKQFSRYKGFRSFASGEDPSVDDIVKGLQK